MPAESTLNPGPAKPAPWTPPSPYPGPVVTPRLVLRFWTPEDAPRMLAAIEAGRGSFSPWLDWTNTDNRTIAECTFNIERFRRSREAASPVPNDFAIGIFDRATGDAVGGTGLHRVNHAFHEGEVGYWVRADRRGEGLCTEAVAHLLTSALTAQPSGWGLRRIHIRCAGGNEPSAAVARKLGLREEARLRGERWVEGRGWQDTLVFGVLADEWDGAAHRPRR